METQPTALSNLQYSLLLDESPGHYRLRKFATKCSYWKKVKVISGMLLITLEAFILKKNGVSKHILLSKCISSTNGFFHIIKQGYPCPTLFLSPDQMSRISSNPKFGWLVPLNADYKLGVTKNKPVKYIFQKLYILDSVFRVGHLTWVN